MKLIRMWGRCEISSYCFFVCCESSSLLWFKFWGVRGISCLLLQQPRHATLIEKESEKEWKTVWEVFPELLDNPRDPAIISLTNLSTTHTSTSLITHCGTTIVTPTTISYVHPQTISYINITTSNNTPQLAKTALSTIPTAISTTTTSFVETVTFPKQLPSNKKNSIKESVCIIIPKGSPPTLDIFPSRDIQLRHHKKYSSSFTQLQTSLTASSISNFKSFTSTSSSQSYHLTPAQNLPLNT